MNHFIWPLAAVVAILASSFAWTWFLRREVRLGSTKLRESERMFRVLAETSPACIFLYQGDRIIYANPATMELLGYSEKECLGLNFWDWVHDDFKELVRERGLARQRGEEVPPRYECKHVCRDGTEKWFFISAGLIEYRGKPAGIVIGFDITDRKRMEEELRHAHEDLEKQVGERTNELAETVRALQESEGAQRGLARQLDRKRVLLRTLIDSIPDLIFYKDPNGVYLGCNKAFQEFAGCAESELTGRTDMDIFPGEAAELSGEMDRKVLSEEGACRNEEWAEYRDGRRVLLDTLRTPYYDQNGRVFGLIGVSRDITERKQAEEKLRRKRELLEELNSTLEKRVWEEVAKNREKDILLIQQSRQAALGELMDHIAHQWKQPLNVINVIVYELADVYGRGGLNGEYLKAMVDNTVALTRHMAQTIDVFRDFYRPDKEKTVFPLKEAIDCAVSFVAPALRFHSVTLDVDVAHEISAIGYPKEYAQVLLNILSNARDAFRERRTKRPRIGIKAYGERGKAVVTITDNAGGIPDGVIDKVFDLYFTTKGADGGTGIGLHMSKNIIEKNMGGAISVRNVDQGAQFRIEIESPG